MFHAAIRKLCSGQFEVKLAYNIKRLGDKIKQAGKKMKWDFEKELQEKFAERDEKGEIKLDENDPSTLFTVADKDKEEFNKAEKEFGEVEIEIERNHITLANLGNMNWSASELTFLEPIYVPLGLVEDEK